eukprot:TRINITY_DN8378_c0_g4_i1.p1 TRINITY_DN8378_c0_g4~~TRINITY_DN8378_c0_g4_i1.p1  ORF type:complete len:148 (-),score=19.31 TRINITY_DN8378_c0_g4_i1:429-842(-)
MTVTVTTIVTEGEVPELVRMVRDLGVTASEVELTGLQGMGVACMGKVDAASNDPDHAGGYSTDDEHDVLDSNRKALEDLFNLYQRSYGGSASLLGLASAGCQICIQVPTLYTRDVDRGAGLSPCFINFIASGKVVCA